MCRYSILSEKFENIQTLDCTVDDGFRIAAHRTAIWPVINRTGKELSVRINIQNGIRRFEQLDGTHQGCRKGSPTVTKSIAEIRGLRDAVGIEPLLQKNIF